MLSYSNVYWSGRPGSFPFSACVFTHEPYFVHSSPALSLVIGVSLGCISFSCSCDIRGIMVFVDSVGESTYIQVVLGLFFVQGITCFCPEKPTAFINELERERSAPFFLMHEYVVPVSTINWCSWWLMVIVCDSCEIAYSSLPPFLFHVWAVTLNCVRNLKNCMFCWWAFSEWSTKKYWVIDTW